MSEPLPQDVILKVADAVGGLMEFWGFKRNMGRMWTLLYLEPAPLSAAEIGERLALSSGAVSMLLADLAQWGAVKKTWVPGERRDFYEPETDIWKMVSRVFRERELRHVRAAIEAFDDALGALAPAAGAATGPEPERTAHARGRIESLKNLAHIGEALLEAMLSGKSIDASPLKRFDRE